MEMVVKLMEMVVEPGEMVVQKQHLEEVVKTLLPEIHIVREEEEVEEEEAQEPGSS